MKKSEFFIWVYIPALVIGFLFYLVFMIHDYHTHELHHAAEPGKVIEIE